MAVYKVRIAHEGVGTMLYQEHPKVDMLGSRPDGRGGGGRREECNVYVSAERAEIGPTGTLTFFDGGVLLALPPGEWLGVVRAESFEDATP